MVILRDDFTDGTISGMFQYFTHKLHSRWVAGRETRVGISHIKRRYLS